jgi:hypothetical protein
MTAGRRPKHMTQTRRNDADFSPSTAPADSHAGSLLTNEDFRRLR